MEEKIMQHTNNILLLEENLKANYNNINQLFLLYKEFMKFIRLLKIYEINRWLLLKQQYKELKIIIKKNKRLYKTVLKNYQNIYTYLSCDDIEINNNKLNNLKLLIDNNTFYMYNLQKEHKFISNKLIRFIKNATIYKTSIINIMIVDMINNHYNKIKYIKKINNDYKVIKNKIKQSFYL